MGDHPPFPISADGNGKITVPPSSVATVGRFSRTSLPDSCCDCQRSQKTRVPFALFRAVMAVLICTLSDSNSEGSLHACLQIVLSAAAG